MIERFNFYDVFGFFIPASLLLLILWLPFGVLSRTLPPADLSSTIVVVIVSYLAGHFLQAWANRAYPLAEQGRYPSSRMLDRDDRRLAAKRDELVRLMQSEFGINVEPVDSSEPERIRADDRRDVAFLLARQRLIARQRVGYAEQFEGLYTMMRGIMAASTIGAVYLFGWIAHVPVSVPVVAAALVLVVVVWFTAMGLRLDDAGLSSPDRRTQEAIRARVVIACILAVAGFGGWLLAEFWPPNGNARIILLAAVIGASALAIQSAGSYHHYSIEFVKAVYRSFLELKRGS